VYTEFFGLHEKPFAITPDPRYLYMSARHTDALAHLIYGISESGGFIQLTGEVGTGKTTLIRSLLEQLPAKADIALILNPQLSAKEFLQVICDELRTPPPADDSLKARIDALNAHLLRVHSEGRRVVLIVDEAQTLSPELLEQVRLLTNLETAKHKLLQIILIGQPELRELLERPEMRQIAQRVTGRYHLEPLGREETAAYVGHRMRVAGALSEIFKPSAINQLYKRSRGIPRLINVIADRALLAAYTEDRRQVDGTLVGRAAAEVFGDRRPGGRWWPWVGIGVAITSFVIAANLWQRAPPAPGSPVAAAAVQRSAAGIPSTAPTRDTPASVTAPPAVTPRAEPLPQTLEAAPAPAGSATPGDAAADERVRLLELLARPDFAADPDSAIGELLGLWGARYDAARGEPCVQALEQGLRCLFQARGSLGELRRVNWPAILAVRDEQGVERQILIASLGYDHADLMSAGTRIAIPLADLSFYWFGDYLLLWRPGFDDGRDLAVGMEDDGVVWLRETLAKVYGEPPPQNPSRVFDEALERRVRQYQRERMLTVDGIVGGRTQVALLAELQLPDTPVLLAGR
jgi:general secretion pathway protein A